MKKLFCSKNFCFNFPAKAGISKTLLLIFFFLTLVPLSSASQENSLDINEKLETRISIDLRNMNVVDVYRFLAMKGNFNISISKNIAGRVTLFMDDVSIKNALEIISIANNLGYRIIGKNVVHIMTEEEHLRMFGRQFSDKRNVTIAYLEYARPAYVLEALKNVKSKIGKIVIDEDTGSVVMIDTDEKIEEMKATIAKIDTPLETRIYKLQYADAEEAARQLRQKIDHKAVGSVQADTRSRQLIIRALPGRLDEVEQIIAALDKKTKAVQISARILKVIFNPKFSKGIDWPDMFTFRHQDTGGSTGKLFDTYAAGYISMDDFQVRLNLSEQVANTKVLANPTITVVNNQEAKIHIGDILAYVTTETIGTGDDQRINEEVHFLDVGVQLNVTPDINEEGFITMKINPVISSQSGVLETPQGSRIPLVDSTRVETEIIARDGETVIIGGLRKDDFIETRKDVPYLSRIPVLGGLFSTATEEEQNTEIVILLTPRIVTGEESATDLLRQQDIRQDKDKEGKGLEAGPEAKVIMPDKPAY